jgi:hypothetical protein
MLHRVAVVRTDCKEKLVASIIRVEKIRELRTTITITGNVRFEVFTPVNMQNGVFWDIKTQFVPQRRHITSPLQSPAG